MKLVGKILAVILIIIAFYTLDLENWDKTVIAILLFLSGVDLLLLDSESGNFQRLAKRLRRLAFTIAILFIIKRIIFG
jgi:multisubunit Na+/H+ antiporter MnhC subunit